MKKLFLLAVTIISLPLVAQAPYGVMIDIDMSPYAGAQCLMLPGKALMRTQDYFDLHTYQANLQEGALRAAELIFLWDPLGILMMVTQHEVFGHGYRIRSLGSYYASVVGYGIDVPPPYGPGGGVTSYNITEALTTTDELTITSAGVEATAIMAGELKKKWLLDDQIDARQAMLYLYSEHDLTQYVLGLENPATDPMSSNDMQGYIYWLNATYPDANLTEGELKTRVLINFLDPMTFYSIFSWFKYIGTGETTGIPMIPTFGAKWLPNFRLGLTPFGPETFLETYIKYKKSLTYFYIKGGNFASNHYYGVGIENKSLWRFDNMTIGLRFDGWRQPPYAKYTVASALEGMPSPVRTGGSSYGMALQATSYYPINNSSVLLFLTVGAKTSGFLPGESLYTAPILRIGLFGML